MKLFLFSLFLSFQASASVDRVSNQIDFHILHGTQEASWNAPSTRVVAKVGQTLRIYNDDTVEHQLHTNGAPCSHGPVIQPGASWDCVIESEYDETKDGLLYEHNVGPSARFYLVATSN